MKVYGDSTFQQEFSQILDNSKLWLKNRSTGLSQALGCTDTLCYFYLMSIEELVRGTLAALREGHLLIERIVSRSLIDYLLDLHLICIRDDEQFNREFVDLRRYCVWCKRDAIDYHREELREAKHSYDKYIQEAVERTGSQLGPKQLKQGAVIPSVEEIARQCERRAKGGWTGLDFSQKLRAVLVESLLGPLSEHKADSIWNRCQEQLRKDDPTGWSHCGFWTQAELTLRKVLVEHNRPPSDIAELDPSLSMALQGWRFGSEFVHPSPRSVVAGLNMKTGEFQWNYEQTDDKYTFAEQLLYLVYRSAVKAASPHLTPQRETPFYKEFQRWTNRTTALRKWQSDVLGEEFDSIEDTNNANRTGDQ